MNATTDLDTPTAQREHKLCATLSARCALLGLVLFKGDPATEGQAPYLITHTGAGVKTFDSLDAVGEHLARLGDAEHGRG